MPFLLDARYQEVAAAIEGLGIGEVRENLGIGLDGNLLKAIYGIGFSTQVQSEGDAAGYDVFALNQLVSRGEVTQLEAETYLSQRYPDQKWNGGRWADLTRAEAAASVVDAASAPSEDPAVPSPSEQAEAVQGSQGGAGVAQSDSPLAQNPIIIDDLPAQYDRQRIQELLDDVLGQVSSSLDAVAAGRIEYRSNSIPGDAIAPGTVDSSRLNQQSIRALTAQIPGPEDAIILQTAMSGGADRWVEADTFRGPGRIWNVTRPIYPAGFKLQPGPTRYRVVVPGTKFGVSSISGDGSIGRVQYGIVIRGIPHFLRRAPIGILGMYAVGDGPVPFAFDDDTGTTYQATGRLFHDRANGFFNTTGKPFVSTFGTDSLLAPDVTTRDGTTGMSVSLITGRTATEVYQQVNSKQRPSGSAEIGARLQGSGVVAGATLPPGGEPSPLTYPSLYVWNGGAQLTVRSEGFDFATDASRLRVAHGLPFRYEDCTSLVPTDRDFAVVVQPEAVRELAFSTAGTWRTPAEWHRNGLEATAPSGRTWAIDIVVV